MANVQIEEQVEKTSPLPVGQSINLVTTDEIRIEVTRTALDAIDMTYYCVMNNEIVLERSESERDGNTLKWFDPVFWTVIVDGKPATESAFVGTETKRWAFKVDHQTRIISFKFEP